MPRTNLGRHRSGLARHRGSRRSRRDAAGAHRPRAWSSTGGAGSVRRPRASRPARCAACARHPAASAPRRCGAQPTRHAGHARCRAGSHPGYAPHARHAPASRCLHGARAWRLRRAAGRARCVPASPHARGAARVARRQRAAGFVPRCARPGSRLAPGRSLLGGRFAVRGLAHAERALDARGLRGGRLSADGVQRDSPRVRGRIIADRQPQSCAPRRSSSPSASPAAGAASKVLQP